MAKICVDKQVTVDFIDVSGTTGVVLYYEKVPEAGISLEHRRAWDAAWRRLNTALDEMETS